MLNQLETDIEVDLSVHHEVHMRGIHRRRQQRGGIVRVNYGSAIKLTHDAIRSLCNLIMTHGGWGAGGQAAGVLRALSVSASLGEEAESCRRLTEALSRKAELPPFKAELPLLKAGYRNAHVDLDLNTEEYESLHKEERCAVHQSSMQTTCPITENHFIASIANLWRLL